MTRRPAALVGWCLVAVVALVAQVACGSGAGTSGGGAGGGGGTVTIANGHGALWTCGFNPFSAAINFDSLGIVYEPLVYVNSLNGKETPMLASSYHWGSGNTTLTFAIRQGVKWSDGQPFTAEDVAFTFDLMKQHRELDLQAAWSVLSSVQAQGDNVVMTFKQPAVPYFYYLADQVGIVPEHVWKSIANPVTEVDRTPVGTGPFTVSQCTPQSVTYTKNPHYWQKGLPKVDKVVYPAPTSAAQTYGLLTTGQADWGGAFMPNIDSAYVARDKAHNHYWFPPTTNVDVFLNQTVAPLNNKTVRQALAYAIDRNRVSKVAESGYQPAANQTGVILPTFKDWYDGAAAAKYGYKFDVGKATSMLESAGFKKGSDGYLHTPQGAVLELSMIGVGSYPDWVSALQVIENDFKQVGIKLDVQNLSSNDYLSKLHNGQFDLAYGTEQGGPTPYYELKNLLYGGNSAPIGQSASSNYERWQSSATDKLLDQYAATTDQSQQRGIVKQLQQTMLEEVPAIPVTESVAWYQYSSKRFTGWPTAQDPYAVPAPYQFPDWEMTLLHLSPAKS